MLQTQKLQVKKVKNYMQTHEPSYMPIAAVHVGILDVDTCTAVVRANIQQILAKNFAELTKLDIEFEF